jgi:tetratricopeptide (TPR) repeat protein
VRVLFGFTVFAVSGALVVSIPSQGHGEPRSPAAAAEARARYEAGVAAYEQGHFDQAIRAFERAHELDPAPILLFNIAQSYRKKGDPQQALLHYRRYLQADPRAPDRAKVVSRIEELEGQLASAPAVAASPALSPVRPTAATPDPAAPFIAAAGPTPRTGERPLYRRPWFWGAMAGVVIAASAALLVSAQSRGGWSCGGDCNWSTVNVPASR